MSERQWWAENWKRDAETALSLSVVVPVYNERYLVGEMLRRLLDLRVDCISQLEIIVVDDASTDDSGAIAEQIASQHPGEIRFFRQERNQGKGAAVRRGIAEATGDLIVIQDADLEYDPRDFSRMVTPFLEGEADVVYGSRFSSSELRRVLYFRHSLGNKLITFFSNLSTDLNLTDVETCYKMFRGPLLKSIPLRSNDFAMEIELTAKIAKRNCAVYEVPISYRGRTYREGKKIGWRDGVKAFFTMLKYWVVDDLYKDDEYGGQILHRLERARRFNSWMADTLRPSMGSRVLEIGAGIGNMTRLFVPRDHYVASDINPNYLRYLRNLSVGKPYLDVARVDLEEAESFQGFVGVFDTVVCLNVLEHVREPLTALENINSALVAGGRLLLYVPQGQGLYSSLDEALGHRCRYDSQMLREEFAKAGFEVESLSQFNRASVPGWWWNGKVLRKRSFSRVQLKVLDVGVPLMRLLDRVLPWRGLGLVAVARKA